MVVLVIRFIFTDANHGNNGIFIFIQNDFPQPVAPSGLIYYVNRILFFVFFIRIYIMDYIFCDRG